MSQSVDKNGAADFLGLTLVTVNRRIGTNKFPAPDHRGSANSVETDWWELTTLEKYKRTLERKKPRKRK